MSIKASYTIKRMLVIAVWIVLGSGAVVLLVAAITRKNHERIAGTEIHINGVQDNYFISKSNVIAILEKVTGEKLDSARTGSLDLAAMEKGLEKNQWIKKAELFFDNNNVLQVKVTEREPIARIFTVSGTSFYMDSSLKKLPLSERFSARLPVFTEFPDEKKSSKKLDTLLLGEVKVLSEFIGRHPFWMAQVEQVNITDDRSFELIPKLGNQLIRFGNADHYQEKFNKLLAFYKKVQTQVGWEKYSVIDVQFKNQVVGVNRNAAEIRSDSLRTIAIMKGIIAEAKKNAADSTKIQLPQPDADTDKMDGTPIIVPVPDQADHQEVAKPSPEPENSSVTPLHNHEKPLIKKQTPVGSKSVIRHSSSNERPNPTPSSVKSVIKKKKESKKQAEKPTEQIKRVPKAVMPSKSDY